jgi:phage anti-repressor protein
MGQIDEDKPNEIKDGYVWLESHNAVPNKEIIQLSKDNPDLIFKAGYLFESNQYDTAYSCTYKNGEEIDVVLEPNYSFCMESDEIEVYKGVMGSHYDELYDRVMEIFKRIDIAKKNDKGNEYIDFVYKAEITVKDDDFQMQVSKEYNSIESIKCFEKQKVTEIKVVPITHEDLFF